MDSDLISEVCLQALGVVREYVGTREWVVITGLLRMLRPCLQFSVLYLCRWLEVEAVWRRVRRGLPCCPGFRAEGFDLGGESGVIVL